MTAGMILLTLQIALQVIIGFQSSRGGEHS